MAHRKHRSLPPRRKRMRRPVRLRAAKAWLQGFGGRHLVRAYARWFGVDRPCAIKELQILGVSFAPEYVRQVEAAARQLAAARRRVRSPAAQSEEAILQPALEWWDPAELGPMDFVDEPADLWNDDLPETERELPF